ncbi:MAG: UbiA family prenyltransferase [Chloroflexota bacterium]
MALGIALLAGGDPMTALRLGAAMVALQASIGALNDVVDAPHDAGTKAGKPIPRELVSVGEARIVVVVAAALGVVLSAVSGPPVAGLAVLILAIGFGYDLRAKGTAWSWLPFALGIPLLPIYAWLGATGSLPPAFLLLVPAGVLGGAALAIANALPDLERDRAAGIESVVTRLGAARARSVHVGLLGLVVVIAVAGFGLIRPPPIAWIALAAAFGLVALGTAIGNAEQPARRERGWELEAVGIGLAAAIWLAGVTSGG